MDRDEQHEMMGEEEEGVNFFQLSLSRATPELVSGTATTIANSTTQIRPCVGCGAEGIWGRRETGFLCRYKV